MIHPVVVHFVHKPQKEISTKAVLFNVYWMTSTKIKYEVLKRKLLDNDLNSLDISKKIKHNYYTKHTATFDEKHAIRDKAEK